MIKFSFSFLLILFGDHNFCQAVKQPVAAGYIGPGAYSKNYVDVFSLTSNQASLAQIKKGAAGVYGEKRFLLSALNMYTAVIALPTKNGNFGLQADYFGFKNYNESQIGLAYARSLGSNLDVGIKFNYYGFRIPAYGNASTINFEIGAIVHVSEKLHTGFHAYNLVGGRLSKQKDEKLSSVYKFGMGYEASESFFIGGEIVKVENNPISVNVGLQYRFQKRFFFKAGIASGTTIGYGGFGISWGNFQLDVSGSYHPQLGLSPGLLFIVYFNEGPE